VTVATGEEEGAMTREHVSGVSPFEPIYGYSRATRVGDQVFLAGTAAVGDDGKTVGVGDPAAQMRRCLETAEAAFAKLGASLDDVVRTRIFITDVAHADAIGRVHGEVFGKTLPASTMVTSGLLNPEWLIELELDAVIDRT
jgi:enamine deaminase RidA (YjgF/YER057c/UK114 family)